MVRDMLNNVMLKELRCLQRRSLRLKHLGAGTQILRFAQNDSLLSFFPSEMRCAEDSARCWFTQDDICVSNC